MLEFLGGLSSLIMGLVALIVVGLVYFLPTILANSRKHHNAAPIMIINLLAGWTLLGWFIALIWSTTHAINTQEKKQ
ncbi:MAG TPA: superinfection immunity protein [Candidatus Babeliales bacterium]|jgi:hypothetical protein|nr:superinfection immunity protein [Candidatus Babeliales bacterium]